ncbi:MAG: DUF4189 domain-containing protein [Mycobacterium sp.]|nr:DUF4189 domain-containing protein [Mycobacterium sp.]
MAKTGLLSAIAAGVLIGGISTGIAWAGGPGGTVEDPEDIFAAVGTGTFEDFADGVGGLGGEAGFTATGDTAEEASAAVLAQCQSAGGVDCTVDEVTNDRLCIVSVGSSSAGVVAGGAGVTVDAARQDAIARAAANNTPLGADAVVIISACP